jgi:hypothetical protein
MGSRQRMGNYMKASTANPTGWRPWNSRLSFYIPNSFPLPTTGRAPFLLQPGVTGRPSYNGGVGRLGFLGSANTPPNFASFTGSRVWRIRPTAPPNPVYGPGSTLAMRLSGLGAPSSTARFRSTNWVPRTNPTGQATATGTTASGAPASGAGVAILSHRAWNQGQRQNLLQQAQQTAGTVIGTDSAGYPIYSSPPAGMEQYGTDSDGNPMYATPGQIAAMTAAGTTGTPTTAAAATTTDATSSIESWFSTDSLGLGLNNAWYLGIGVGAYLLFFRKRGR